MTATLAIAECTNQVLRFFRYLDARNYDALAALLDADAIWRRQGKVLKGPAAALEALAQRSPTMRIAHVITNLASDDCGQDRCDVRGYMLVVRHEPGQALAGPAPLRGIESIRDLRVELARRGQAWLITELSAEDVLFAQNA